MCSVQCKAYLDLVPLDVVHVVLVDAQLCSGQRHARHLVLQRADLKRARNYMMKQQLEAGTVPRINSLIHKRRLIKI